MRIVITGATGFIGSYLATLFLREGAEVFALSRPDSPNLKALPVHENLHIVPWSMDRAGDWFCRRIFPFCLGRCKPSGD